MPPKSRSILTPAQWRVLERLAQSESNPTIARALGVALPTVQTHVCAINQRLRLRAGDKRAAAIAWYLREGRRHREGAE